MFKKYISIIFIFITLYSFSHTFVLKEKIYTNKNTINLQDIILNDLPDDMPNINIADLDENSIILTSSKILELLFNKSIFDIVLIGENINIIFQQETLENSSQNKEVFIYKNDPLEYLEGYFESFLDKNIFTVKIELKKIEPEINIKIIRNNFNWKLSKSYYNLTDLKKLKKLILVIDDNIYNATIEIKIFSNIWNAKQSFQKGDSFSKDGFLKNHLDITKIDNFENLVFNIENANNSIFTTNISHGEILTWKNLKKNPDVLKGESINAVLTRNQIEIILPCVMLIDGYKNDKVKVKLINGKEIIGTLRNNNGEKYIEIL